MLKLYCPLNVFNKHTQLFGHAIKELFVAATSKDPPRGIGHSPQSRAVYGIDFSRRWTTYEKDWLISLLKKETSEINAKHYVYVREKCHSHFPENIRYVLLMLLLLNILLYILLHITNVHTESCFCFHKYNLGTYCKHIQEMNL